MVSSIIARLQSLVAQEKSCHKLALSFCVGVYIAFSPFIGLHTAMALFAIWAFKLNGAATFAGSLLINNPWTMVPVYSIGYLFGDWLLACGLGIDVSGLNPAWMGWISDFFVQYTGFGGISLWSFIIGGNVLGVLIGIMLYPFMRHIFLKCGALNHS